ncbi:putative protein TPRXL [Ixodes scapularis]
MAADPAATFKEGRTDESVHGRIYNIKGCQDSSRNWQAVRAGSQVLFPVGFKPSRVGDTGQERSGKGSGRGQAKVDLPVCGRPSTAKKKTGDERNCRCHVEAPPDPGAAPNHGAAQVMATLPWLLLLPWVQSFLRWLLSPWQLHLPWPVALLGLPPPPPPAAHALAADLKPPTLSALQNAEVAENFQDMGRSAGAQAGHGQQAAEPVPSTSWDVRPPARPQVRSKAPRVAPRMSRQERHNEAAMQAVANQTLQLQQNETRDARDVEFHGQLLRSIETLSHCMKAVAEANQEQACTTQVAALVKLQNTTRVLVEVVLLLTAERSRAQQSQDLSSPAQPPLQPRLVQPPRAQPSRAEPSRAQHRRAEPSRTQHRRIQHRRVQHRRVQHRRVQHRRAQHRRAQHRRAQHRRVQHRRVQHRRVQHRRVQHRRAQHRRAQHRRAQHRRAQHRRAQHRRAESSHEFSLKRQLFHVPSLCNLEPPLIRGNRSNDSD